VRRRRPLALSDAQCPKATDCRTAQTPSPTGSSTGSCLTIWTSCSRHKAGSASDSTSRGRIVLSTERSALRVGSTRELGAESAGSQYFAYCFPQHIPAESDLVLVELGTSCSKRADALTAGINDEL
jgi:hypothetical protein